MRVCVRSCWWSCGGATRTTLFAPCLPRTGALCCWWQPAPARVEIIKQNIAQLKKIGNQEAVVGNPDSTPLFKQV